MVDIFKESTYTICNILSMHYIFILKPVSSNCHQTPSVTQYCRYVLKVSKKKLNTVRKYTIHVLYLDISIIIKNFLFYIFAFENFANFQLITHTHSKLISTCVFLLHALITIYHGIYTCIKAFIYLHKSSGSVENRPNCSPNPNPNRFGVKVRPNLLFGRTLNY